MDWLTENQLCRTLAWLGGVPRAAVRAHLRLLFKDLFTLNQTWFETYVRYKLDWSILGNC